MKTKFKLGEIYFTDEIKKEIQKDPGFSGFLVQSLRKHQAGDWGTLCDSDWKYNDLCLANNSDRLFSSYPIRSNSDKPNEKIWIITSFSQKNTTILFPHEN